jgi:glutathione S-transferase
MKIYYSHASPFARKCRIILRFKGLLSQFDEIEALPLSNPPELIAANPIVQVPTMILDNGQAVFNSHLICTYLDRMGDAPSIYGDDDLEARRIETIADGICEMAVKIAMENRRPENERSPMWIKRWQDNIIRALLKLDYEIKDKEIIQNNIGYVSIACALSYIDLRFAELISNIEIKNLRKIQNNLELKVEFRHTFPR